MALKLSSFLILFGVVALTLGQLKDEERKDQSSLLSQILRVGDVVKDTDLLSENVEAPLGRGKRQIFGTPFPLPTWRPLYPSKPIIGQSLLNPYSLPNFSNLAFTPPPRSILEVNRYRGIGYQYDTPNGKYHIAGGFDKKNIGLGLARSFNSGKDSVGLKFNHKGSSDNSVLFGIRHSF